jgi:hypothetical protein
MNPITTTAPNVRKYLLAIGAVAILAIGAVGFSALFAHADSGPTVNTVTTNSANAVVTSAVIGTNIFEGAKIASSTSANVPTGTVTYTTFANQSCTGTPTVQSGVGLVNGMASSSANTVTNAGLSYIINYNGDGANLPSVSSCTVVTPTSAAVTVTNALSASSVNTGSSVTSHATLSNNTSVATGTVAYHLYTDNACTLATTSPASVTVVNGVVPTSAAVTFNQAGTYYWQAVYSGDNANAAATSSCTGSILTVAAPTVTPPPVTGTGTISGMVFSDTNKNGKLDSGEAGVAGVTIQLSILQNNWWLSLVHMQKYVPVTTTVSDANGNYSFGNLSGVYKVEEIKKAGVAQTSRDFQPVQVSGTQGAAGLNFANKANATSTNMGNGKGHDKNDNDNDGDDNGKIASTTKMVNIKAGLNINANLHSILKGDNGNHKGEGKDN